MSKMEEKKLSTSKNKNDITFIIKVIKRD